MILCISFLKVKFYYPATFVFLLVRRRESLAANRIETVSNHSRVKAKEERRRKRRRYECKSTRISTRHSQLRVRNLDETTLDFVYVRVSRTKKVEGGGEKWRGWRMVRVWKSGGGMYGLLRVLGGKKSGLRASYCLAREWMRGWWNTKQRRDLARALPRTVEDERWGTGEGNGARCEGREINSEWRFADAREKKDCEIANIIRDEKKILYASFGIMKFRKRDRKSFFLGRFVVIKFRSNVSSRDCYRSLRVYTKYPIKRSIFPLVNCCVRTSFFFLFFFQWS